MIRRILAMILVITMCLSMMPVSVMAEDGVVEDGIEEPGTENVPEPTPEPEAQPTPEPTTEPSGEPEPVPSSLPTPEPSAEPTPEPSQDPTTLTVAEWSWVDKENSVINGELVLSGASADNPALFGDVTALLPAAISCEFGELAISWHCADYPADGAYEGNYIFSAVLPEGYALAEGAAALSVAVSFAAAQTVVENDGEAAPASDDVLQIDEANFPDNNFRNYIMETFDTQSAGYLTAEQVAAVTVMNCSNQYIESLDGIEHFTALTELNCSDNGIAGTLDLTQNTQLTKLNCSGNYIDTLKLSHPENLTELDCSDCYFTALDLSAYTGINELSCAPQHLILFASEDANGYFVDLSVFMGSGTIGNIISVTGGSFNAQTGEVRLTYPEGETSLSFSYRYAHGCPTNAAIMTVEVEARQPGGDMPGMNEIFIDEFSFPDENFRAFISENFDPDGIGSVPRDQLASVTELDCESMGISDLTGIEHFTGLESLKCGGNKLASLDVSALTTLKTLSPGIQTIELPVEIRDGAYVVDLAAAMGQNIDLLNGGVTGGTYSADTGLVTVGESTTNLNYSCSVGFNGDYSSNTMYVNVSLIRSEETGNKLYINEENFPDAAFRQYISDTFDTEGTGYLTEMQVAAVTEIRCDDRNISDLTGLEHFTALRSLSCRNNPITTLDLSGYTALAYMQDNAFAGCTKLQTVILPPNLVSLGYYTFLNCSALESISIPGSVMAVGESAFANCSSLANVTLGNGVRVIGASAFGGCSALRSITIPASVVTVESNAFAESGLNTIIFEGSAPAFGLNIFQGVTAVAKYPAAASGWTADVLQNYGGSISWQTVGEGFIDGKLYINEQNFPDGDFRAYISNAFDTAGVGYLTTEQVDAVTQIYCIYKGIDALTGIEHFRNLEYLNCGSNQIRHLDLSRNNALKHLYCTSNGMETLDVSGCLELEYLHCSYNELTELNLNGCAYLTSLSCDRNALTSLDLSGCTALQFVNCYDNELTELSLSGCASLQELNCYSNKLAALNIIGCTALQRLNCEYNELTELDVSDFAQLNHLSCTSNKLQTLNIAGCTALQYLDCGFNDIAELDISGCTQLNSIRCAENELEELDVSALTLLDNLECSNNRLPLLDLSGDHVYLDYVYGWGQDAGSRQAELKSGSFVLDMAKVVGAENIARVRNVTGGSYDADTGLITLRRTGTALSIPVSYQFDTGRDDVEFTVTLEAMLPLNLSGSCGDNVTWSFDDGVLTISGSGPMYNYGQSIYAFGGRFPWQQWPELVRSLVVEEGVTAIGKGAFEGCTALTEVSLPNSLKSIGITAFSSCEALETIRLPEGLETIGDQAFYCAYKLRSVNIPSTVTYIGDGAFSDTALEEVFFLADVQRFNGCFSYCKNLKTVVIREGMFAITGEAFRGCTALESVTIPASVELIDPWAFEGCTALKELIIAEDNPAFSFKDGALLSKDGNKLIAYIGNGTQVSVPVGVEVIGQRAFAENSRLTSVRLPFTVKSIEQDAFFNCSKLESVHLNEGLETIGDMAFYSCGLTSITLPRSLKSLGAEAFWNCYDLYDIRMSGVGDHLMLKDGVLYSADGTILHMALTQLEGEFIVPAGVKKIGDNAINHQFNLQSIVLPEGLEVIGNHALYSLNIQTIDLPASLREIGAYAFANTQIHDWVIPAGVTVKGGLSFAEGWAARKILFLGSAPSALLESRDFEIYFENAVVYYPADDPSWSESARESLHAEGVTWVGYSSAGLCGSGLTWMLDDNGLLRIGGSGAMADYSVSSPAPWGSAVRSVIVEAGVSYIGSCAFAGCDNLSSVIFEGGAPAIADDAFSGVEATVSYPFADSSWTDELLTNYGGSLSWAEDAPNGVSDYGAAWSLRDGVLTVTAGSNGSSVPDYEPGQAPWYAYRDSITAVVFGPGMQTIGSNAFADLAALTSVTMPMVGTGWFIYGDAFANCTALEEITLPFGGEGYISDNAFAGCSALSKIDLLGAEPTLEDNAFAGLTATVTYPSHWEIIPGHDYGGSLSWVAREQEGGSCGENTVWTYENGVLTISGSGPMEDYRDPMMMSDGRDFAPWSGLRNSVTSVVVGEGITHIGENAFNRFFYIKSVSLPDGLESIGIGAFAHCYVLTNFDIPETVTEIGAGAFMNCSSLTSLELPVGITEIPDSLVANCPSLASIHIPEGVTSIGSMAFGGCYGLKEVTLPASVTKIADRAFWLYTALSAIHVDEDNRCFSSVDGVLYNKDRTELIKCPEEKRGEVTIPASVTKLHYEAFADCNLLEVITFAGSAPEIIDYGRQFRGVNAIIRYPAGDGSWDELVGNNYQGMLLWKEYTPVVTKLYINAENFPDAAFRQYISDTFDTEGVGYLTREQVDAVTDIECVSRGVADFTGIENFTNINCIICGGNPVTELDVSSFPGLLILSCGGTGITSLDLSANTALEKLEFHGSPITTIDLSANTALWYLRFEESGVTNIDLSANTALTELICDSNKLAALNLGANTQLSTLSCENQKISLMAELRDGAYVVDLAALAGSDNLDKISNVTGGSYDAVTGLVTLDVGPTVMGSTITYDYDPHYAGDADFRMEVSIHVTIKKLYINAENFPDPAFRRYISDTFDTEGVGYLTGEQVAAVQVIRCDNMGITDLSGIEYFTGLRSLLCFDNAITELDLSANTALVFLSASRNEMTGLNVSNCPALTNLACAQNKLTELDLSGNSALTQLECHVNALTELDLSHNTALTYVYCQENHLTTLELGGLTQLDKLVCSAQSTEGDAVMRSGKYVLDMAELVGSENLDRIGNVTGGSYDAETGLATLSVPAGAEKVAFIYDYAHNGVMEDPAVMTVRVEVTLPADTNLYINAENFPDKAFRQYISDSFDTEGVGYLTAEQVTSITEISCRGLDIADLTGVEHFTQLTALDCGNNKLTALDVSANTRLTDLNCGENALTALDVSALAKLSTLVCSFNKLTALDVSGNTQLEQLICSFNEQLTELDVSALSKLNFLSCECISLSELDVSNNSALTFLACTGSPIGTLDVSANTQLRTLICSDNGLTQLDVSHNTQLQTLCCDTNALTELDLSALTELSMLLCDQNELTELDLSANGGLCYLSCVGNKLSTLDLSACPNIGELYCGGNLFAALDLSDVGELSELRCGSAADESDPSQKPAFTAWLRDGNYWLDLAGALGEADLSRVSNITGGRIDEESGLVIVAGSLGAETAPLGYDYATGNGDKLMHAEAVVTLRVDSNLYINERNFPDAAFRQYISDTFDTEGVGYLTSEQVAAVTEIHCDGREIRNLTGVEHFTNLQVLYCQDNAIESLDLSANTALLRLDCSLNALTELDLSANTALENLNCFINELSSLNVSGCKALVSIACYQNKLAALDVSGNSALTDLLCSSNLLTSLELAANTKLEVLECEKNKLTELDVSANKALRILNCNWNALSELDVSGNTALTSLTCGANKLTELDVTALTELETLDCGKNLLHTLDVSQNTKLSGYFGCYWNSLTSLELSGLGPFQMMECFGQTIETSAELLHGRYVVDMAALLGEEKIGNISVVSGGTYDAATGLVTLTVAPGSETAELVYHYDPSYAGDANSRMDVTVTVRLPEDTNLYINAENFPDAAFRQYISDTFDSEGVGFLTTEQVAAVTDIYAGYLEIADLTGVEHFHALKLLDCSDNQLTELNVSANTALETLLCRGNDLSELDISANTALKTLDCSYNALAELDSSANTALTALDCGNNRLTVLNVSRNTQLKRLYCGDNALAKLDLSKNTALVELDCSGNALTALDLSRNGALVVLICKDNRLSKLDLSKNTSLTDLYCSKNALTALDVSRNTQLRCLDCGSNPLSKLDVSGNKELRALICDDIGLGELNLAANVALEELYCSGNALTVLDLSHNPALRYVDCVHGDLAMLDVSGNPALTADSLSCGDQTPSFSAALDGGRYVLDMAAIVGAENISRIANVVGGDYDAETGLLTLSAAPGASSTSIIYEYSIEFSSGETSIMDVNAGVKLPDLNQKCGDDLYWSYSQRTGTLTITGTGDMWNFEETGAPWYELREGISTVKLPKGMTSIGDHAFSGCRLKKVDVPAHVNYVGAAAFLDNPIANIYFSGNAPVFAPDAFASLTANAHYPINDVDWTEDVRQNYGGNIHWVTLDNDNVASGCCGPTTRWALKKNGTLTISGLGEVTDAPWKEYMSSIVKVVVEEGVRNIPDYGFWSFSSAIKSVTLPDGLERIGNYAFSGCSKLSSLTIPASVTHVGEAAFRNCSGLKGFTLASGSRSFRVENGVLYNYAGTTMICCPSGYKGQLTVPYGVTKLEPLAVYGCSQLTGVSLPDSLTEIGSWNFYACAKLKEVTIPENVKYIGELSFEACDALSVIEFMGDAPAAEGFPTNGEGTSEHVLALYPANNPTWTQTVRDAICSSCTWQGVERDYSGVGSCGSSLTWLLQDGVLHIYGSGMMDSFDQAPWYSLRHGICAVVVEEGVTTISANAFRGCLELTEVSLPASIMYVEGSAFRGCTKIERFTIAAGTHNYTVSDGALYEGSTLRCVLGSVKDFVVPASVDSIGEYAFADSVVESVEIPESVRGILSGAFTGCAQLKNVYFRGSMPDFIESNAFTGVAAEVFYPSEDESYAEELLVDYGGSLSWKPFHIISGSCGEGLSWTLDDWGTLRISGEGVLNGGNWGEYVGRIIKVELGSGVQGVDSSDFSGCVNLSSFAVDAASEFHAAVDGVLYDKSMTTLLYCPFAYSGELRIPEGVTVIADKAALSSAVSAVSFPETLISIGEMAFMGCNNLKSLSIPASVTDIAPGAFGFCPALVSVTVDGASESFVSVDNILYDSELETLLLCPAGLGGEIVPLAVSAIGERAFAGCSKMTAISFPDGLGSIGLAAFNGCTGLTQLDLPETLESIGDFAFVACEGVREIIFHGSAPDIAPDAFSGITASVSYNHMDESWAEHVGNNYGGSLDWNSMVRASGEIPGFAWVLDNYGKLTISGSGAMPDFAWTAENDHSSAPWYGYSDEIYTVNVESGATYIGAASFAGCVNLAEVNLPAGLTIIGANAFINCGRLSHIDLPTGLSTIGDSAFSGTSLAEVTLPDTLRRIDANAFASCDLLRVDIPASVETIGERAFADNTLMKAAIIRSSGCELGESVFSGWKKLTVYGENDSSAKSYAKKYKIPFALLEEAPPVLEGIRLSEEYVKLPVGGKLKLTVQPVPANAILPPLDYWNIDNSLIASVDAADDDTLQITAIEPGEAGIHVYCGRFAAVCRLDVRPVLAEIVLPEELELAVGTETVIAAEFLPGEAFLNETEWKSSSKSVLSIEENEDGSVTLIGNKAGSATVTVTNGKIKSSIKVTVLKQSAEAIEIYDSDEVRVDGQTLYFQERSGHKVDFSAIVRPDNSDSKLKWSSDNGQVASVDQKGRVNIKKAGIARITVRATDAEAVCSSFLVVVMDCDPKLSASKLSINSFFTDGSDFAVEMAEDCELISVELVQKTKDGEYVPLDEISMEKRNGGGYTLRHAPLQKASYSAYVKVESYNAYLDETLVHYLPLKLTVTNTKPSVKMAVSTINAYYGNLSWSVTPTVKNAVLEGYVLAADSSPYFTLDAAGRIVLSPEAKALLAENPNARINRHPIVFEVSCVNAAEPVRVSVKPSVVYKQPSVKIGLDKINVYYSADTWAVTPQVTNGELESYRLAPDSSPYFELNGLGRLTMTQAARALQGDSEMAVTINKKPLIFEVLFRDAAAPVRVSVKPGVICKAPAAKLSLGKINTFYTDAAADITLAVSNGELAGFELAPDSSPYFELGDNGRLLLNEQGRAQLEANPKFRFTQPVIFLVSFVGADSVSTISVKPSVVNTAPKLQLRNAEGKTVSSLTYSSFFAIQEAELVVWDVTNDCPVDISAVSVDNAALEMSLKEFRPGEATLRWNGEGKLGKTKLSIESANWTKALTLSVTAKEEKQPGVSFSQSGKLDLIRRDTPLLLVPKLSNATGAAIENIRLLSVTDAKGNDSTDSFELVFDESSLRAELKAKDDALLSKQKYKLTMVTDLSIGSVRNTVVSTVTVTPTQSKLTVKTQTMTMARGETALQILTLQPEGVVLRELYVGSLPAGVSARCDTERGEILLTVSGGAKSGSHTLVFYAGAEGAQSGTAATKVSVKLKIN